MTKMNYSKVEKALEDSIRNLSIAHLSELAALANATQDPKTHAPKKVINEILVRFKNELNHLKEKDRKFFEKLNITDQELNLFSLSADQLNSEDWANLARLKVKIDEVKKELIGPSIANAEDENLIEEQKLKHINKRFNIRDGWLPLK